MFILDLPEVLQFDWDEGNEYKNWIKHQISGKEAEDVFYDEDRLILEDVKHSKNESRFIIIGRSKQSRLLFIIFTIRKNKVRVISARNADKKEVLFYEKATNIT